MVRKAATRPFVDGMIPTTLDKKFAPEGMHIFSMFSQWVPDDWVQRAAPRGARGVRGPDLRPVHELAPNFKSTRSSTRQVIGPYDMEQDLGLIGGNIFHGELSRRSAVPHAPGARVRGLPHADQGPVPRVLRDPRAAAA